MACIKKRPAFKQVEFYEISLDKCDPTMPQRWRVGLTPELEAELAQRPAKTLGDSQHRSLRLQERAFLSWREAAG